MAQSAGLQTAGDSSCVSVISGGATIYRKHMWLNVTYQSKVLTKSVSLKAHGTQLFTLMKPTLVHLFWWMYSNLGPF